MIAAVWLMLSGLLYALQLQTGSFPKPLTAKEEQHYLALAAEGDMDARNVLIERNLRLVAHIMKKYYAQTSDQEDLISIGTIGLIKGIESFDSSKGARLATYAARCVENAILSPATLREDAVRPKASNSMLGIFWIDFRMTCMMDKRTASGPIGNLWAWESERKVISPKREKRVKRSKEQTCLSLFLASCLCGFDNRIQKIKFLLCWAVQQFQSLIDCTGMDIGNKPCQFAFAFFRCRKIHNDIYLPMPAQRTHLQSGTVQTL